MAEGGEGFDDLEMKNLDEYKDISNEQLEEELNETVEGLKDMDIKYGAIKMPRDVRVSYNTYRKDVRKIRSELARRRVGQEETSFIDTDDGKTVTIRGTSTKVPAVVVDLPSNPENMPLKSIEKFISSETGTRFKLNDRDSDVLALRLRVSTNKKNDVLLKPRLYNNELGKERVVLKRGEGGVLKYNNANARAVNQFKDLIRLFGEIDIC